MTDNHEILGFGEWIIPEGEGVVYMEGAPPEEERESNRKRTEQLRKRWEPSKKAFDVFARLASLQGKWVRIQLWDTLLEIAQKEGWKPMGTVRPTDMEYEDFENDYRPHYPAYKTVLEEDAHNFALALKTFRDKLIKNEVVVISTGPVIIRDADAASGAGVFYPDITMEFLHQFIPYIEQGQFEFWWDD